MKEVVAFVILSGTLLPSLLEAVECPRFPTLEWANFSHCPEEKSRVCKMYPTLPSDTIGQVYIGAALYAYVSDWRTNIHWLKRLYPGALLQLIGPSGRSAGYNPEWYPDTGTGQELYGFRDCGTLGLFSFADPNDPLPQGNDETDEPDPYPAPFVYDVDVHDPGETGWYTLRVYGRPFTRGGMYHLSMSIAKSYDRVYNPRLRRYQFLFHDVRLTIPNKSSWPTTLPYNPDHPFNIPIGPTEVQSYQFYLDPDAFPHPVTLYRVIPIIVKPPGEGPKPIQPSSPGKTPIAILSQGRFSAPEEVEVSSLRAGKTGTENSVAFCHPDGEDVNQDGKKDLVCQFFTEKLNLSPGDTELILTGKTRAPRDYEFRATYPIRIVPPGKP